VDKLWQAFLRRFDLEHTFRMFKQTLGWTAPKLREPAAADRWTWLVIAAHTQLPLPSPSQKTSATPGSGPHAKGASPRRVSVEDFAASTGKPLSQPAHRNPPPQAPAGQPA
jgi:hypothetical protein